MIWLYFLIIIISALVLVAIILIIFVQIIAVFTTDAPFVSVPGKIANNIITALELSANSILYDLGCGDGRILIDATQQHPGIQAVGVEKAIWPYLLAKFLSRNNKNIIIRREDIFMTNITDATHIFLYLYPSVINKLIHNIQNQCKPGTKIVSCDFELENISPIKVVELDNTTSKRGQKLFIYSI